MPDTAGHFALVLHSHIPYVLDHGRWPHGMDWLSEAAAECYLPLIRVCDRLVAEGVSPKITLGLTPILVEQLADPSFHGEFDHYLSQKIACAVADAAEFRSQRRPEMAALADRWADLFGGLTREFDEMDRDIPGAFRRLQDEGHIEILTSAATHGYLPLLGSDAAVQAQVRQGVATYRKHFRREPRGFWLPECAYRPRYPWQPPLEAFRAATPTERKGVDEILMEEGLAYFFVDAHLLKGGRAVGVYADRFKPLEEMWSRFEEAWRPEQTDRSPYRPYLVNSSGAPKAPLAVFARDHVTGIQVWSGETGYPGDEHYLEFHKKRYPGMLRYWRVSWPRDDLEKKGLYEPVKALGRLQPQAEHFRKVVRGALEAHREEHDEPGILTAMYDTELFGHWWHEGAEWLYHAIRELNDDPAIVRVTSGEYLETHPPETVVALPEGSWGEGGYHWIWLNEWTQWTWAKVYECERRLSELAAAHASNPGVRTLLQQLARELLLLESSDWQFCISTWASRDYAEERVRFHADRFEKISNLLDRVLRKEDITPEEWGALGEAEDRDRCFPEVDPSWWIPM